MTNITREIIKNGAPSNALQSTLKTIDCHKKDLIKRIAKQEKALSKTIEKGWAGKDIIETGIADMEKALEVVCEM